MLADAKLPASVWGETVVTACTLRNVSHPTASKAQTPWELFYGSRPDLSTLRAYGSKTFVHVRKEKRNKLGFKSVTGVLVGYPFGMKGYRVYLGNNKVVTSRDCIFDERPLQYELPLHTTSDPFEIESVENVASQEELNTSDDTDSGSSGGSVSDVDNGGGNGGNRGNGNGSGASSGSDSDSGDTSESSAASSSDDEQPNMRRSSRATY